MGIILIRYPSKRKKKFHPIVADYSDDVTKDN